MYMFQQNFILDTKIWTLYGFHVLRIIIFVSFKPYKHVKTFLVCGLYKTR